MATTIAVSHETKEKLRNLGRTGESFDEVINRMYEVSKQHILKQFLYDESDSMTLEDARKRINGKGKNN